MNRRYYNLEYEDSIDIDEEAFDIFFESDPAELYDEYVEDEYGEDSEEDYDNEGLAYNDNANESAEDFYPDASEFDQSSYEQDDPDPIGDSAFFSDALDESYLDAPDEALQEWWADMMESITPAEGFNFKKVLRQIGKTGQQIIRDPTVGQIARTVLPAAGATVGTIYGGPMGGALGGQLGQAAGQVFSGGTQPAPKTVAKAAPAPAAKTKQAPAVPVAKGSPQVGSVAAARLLQLTQDPNLLKSLIALSLGAKGRKSIPAGGGGPAVNLGSYMNLLGVLASQAAADADALAPYSDAPSDYLLDAEGEFIKDPSNSEARAMLLYKALTDAANQRLLEESAPPRPWSDFFPFAAKTKLLVEYQLDWAPDPNIGTGVVLKRTRNFLKLIIHIDKIDRWGVQVSETEVLIEIQYKGEGPGNRARIVVNGQEFIDDNVTIQSKKAARILGMSITILGESVRRIVLNRVDSGEAELKFKAQGDTHVLVLSRK